MSVVPCEAVAGGRLVLAATGILGPYDDVRYVRVSRGRDTNN